MFFAVALLVAAGAMRAAAADKPVTIEEALGAAVGAALYNTQVVIGITADSFTKQVYTSDETKTIVKEQKSLLNTLGSYASALIDNPSVEEADKAAMRDILACIGKLNSTADALIAYVDDASDANAQDFQTKRKDSYKSISDLLGLDKQQ